MKNTTLQILANCEHGLYTLCKNNEGYFIEFNPLKDEDGNFRYFGWWDTKESAQQSSDECYGYSPEEIDKENLEILEVYHKPFKKFEVGQKVRFLETIKETEDWEDYEKYFPNMIGEIKSAYNEISGLFYSVWSEDEQDCWSIGHEYLSPIIDSCELQEGKEAVICQNNQKYKVKIIKKL